MTRKVVNSRPWLVLAVFCALYLAAQVLPVTRLAFDPQEVQIEGDQVTLVRTFPADALGLQRPRISYVEEVRPLSPSHNGGHPCTEAAGPFRYDAEEPLGSWSIPWAAACLDDPRGYVWEATWTWHVGVFTFGPVTLSTRVLKEALHE